MNKFSDTFQTVSDRDLFGVHTPTRWLTNSGCIAQAFIGTGKLVAIGQTVMKAMSQQLQADLCDAAATDHPEHRLPLPKLDILAVDADEEPQQEGEAEDDVKGGPLDPHQVKIALQKEIQYLWDWEVYEYSTEAESRTRTGRNPAGLKWVDTIKGCAEAPRYLSRLVRSEDKGVEPIFSVTPPLENYGFYSVSRVRKTFFRFEDPFLVSTADVNRAHFYADAVRDVCIPLPDEDPKAKQPGVCGKLRKTMYGSLVAAQRW